jgi:hypothetical protein
MKAPQERTHGRPPAGDVLSHGPALMGWAQDQPKTENDCYRSDVTCFTMNSCHLQAGCVGWISFGRSHELLPEWAV